MDRMAEAWLCHSHARYVCAVYLGGLAVECILQAHAIRLGSARDARHDLHLWLSQCPAKLQRAMTNESVRRAWSQTFAVWRNQLRYYSEDAMLGYLRQKQLTRGLRGHRRSVLRTATANLLTAFDLVQKKGLASW